MLGVKKLYKNHFIEGLQLKHRDGDNLGDNYHYEMGRLSGYSKCCMYWFIIRSRFFHHMPNLFFKYWKWRNNTSISFFNVKKSKARHVFCLFCRIKYAFKSFNYYKCLSCQWTQFQKKECNMCAIFEQTVGQEKIDRQFQVSLKQLASHCLSPSHSRRALLHRELVLAQTRSRKQGYGRVR